MSGHDRPTHEHKWADRHCIICGIDIRDLLAAKDAEIERLREQCSKAVLIGTELAATKEWNAQLEAAVDTWKARAEKVEAERDAAVKALEPFAIQAERILKGCVRADGSSWVGDDSSWHLLLSLNTHPNEIITGADLRRAAALPKLKTETASG